MTVDVAIRHHFGAFRLDAAFAAPPGVTALFGRSGAGKTTVVNAIAGLLRPDRGRIEVDGALLLDTDTGVFVPRHRRRVGYVFQEGRLFPHLTVRQNLAFGRWFAPRAAAGGPDMAHVVEMLALGPLLDRRPGRLSGGEKSRTAIGRALLAAPRLLLLDEPLASLDEGRKAEILPYLERLRDEVRMPIIYVSHSLPEVARLATTVVALSDGRVIRADRAADVLSDPELFPLMGREEAGSLLGAWLVAHDSDGLSRLALGGGHLIVPQVDAPPGAHLRVRIRARDVMLATVRPASISALNVLDAVVEAIGRSDGAIVEVALRVGEDRLLARITRRSLSDLALAPGRPCFALVTSIAVGRRDLGVFEERDP